MSYFNTLNQFVENAEEANNHLDSIKDDLVSSKISDIRDQFNQHLSNIENFGQATLGASGAFHLGRKIYKKVKAKYGSDPAKDKKKKDEEEDTEDEEDADEENPRPPAEEPPVEDEGLTSMSSENSTEFSNPLFTKDELTSSENPSAIPNEAEQSGEQNIKPTEGEETDLPSEVEGGFKSNAAVESSETAERAEQVSQQAEELGGRAQSLLERLQSATGTTGGGAAEPKTNPIKESEDPALNEDSGVADTSDFPKPRNIVSNEAEDAVESSADMDGFEAASAASRTAVKEAGGGIAKSIGEKIGINIAEDVGGAVLDAIPIVGEIAGVAQIFHGLFHEHKERVKERAKEASTAISIKAGGGVAAGGLDLGSVLPQGAAVAGLV